MTKINQTHYGSGDNVAGNKIVIGNQPRTLNEDQKKKLISILSGQEKVKIGFISKLFDPEAKNFSENLSEAFEESGWEVIRPFNQTLLDDYGGCVNMFIGSTANVKNNIQEIVNSLHLSLNEIGILSKPSPYREASVSGDFSLADVYIAIGSKKINS